MLSLKKSLVGREIFGWLVSRTMDNRLLELAGDTRGHHLGYLVLDGEYVLQVAIIVFGPDMSLDVSTSINCAVTLIWLPARRTLPSTMY